MRMHTRERPYSCEVCHKRFIWRDSVKKHMETHITAAKYSCRLCGKWFRWLQGIRQHLQQQHKLKKCDVEAQVLNGGPSALFQKHPQDQFFHNDPSRTITADPSDTMAAHPLQQQHTNSAVEASNHPGILIRLEDDLSIANNSGEYICGEKQNEVQEAVRSIQILEPQSSPPASHEILHGVSDQSEALPIQPGERLDVEAIYLVENEESHPNNTTLLDENPRESTDKSDLNRPLRSLQSIEQDQSRDYDNLILDAQTGSANSKEWRPRYFVHENSTCNVESSSSNTNQREGNVSSNVITTESQNSSMLPCNVIYDNVQQRTSSNNPDLTS
ncbi:zinc finger protein 726 [Hyalella azteca]|uniref:Zinc finger protein 726 n=1 Tax=Hyalella azteca TaxID=294128 RepID=A0A8B7NN71_HYAAZ|nr:zinc finger protein 726 [Hyalella azteca]